MGALAIHIQTGPGPTSSVTVVGRNPLVGQPAPAFSLQTVDGQTISLADLHGRPAQGAGLAPGAGLVAPPPASGTTCTVPFMFGWTWHRK